VKQEEENIMARLSMSSIGPLLREKRGNKGMREAAGEMGISSATLSRVENGKLPDLETFSKICKWLNISPNEILGCSIPKVKEVTSGHGTVMVHAHLRAEKTLDSDVAKALADMILAAQNMISVKTA
jgi:transcriptional regulator with XRE-family HTH domain